MVVFSPDGRGDAAKIVGCRRRSNENRSAIDHDYLSGAEGLLHQEQVGLRNVMSFKAPAHGQTGTHALMQFFSYSARQVR